MIYRNGTPWEGWKEDMKGVELKKDAQFNLSEHYTTMRRIGKNRQPLQWVKTYATSVMFDLNYTWTDKEGVTWHIQYAERVDKVKEGKETIDRFHPTVMEIQKGKFTCPKAKKDLYWFLMNHPANQNAWQYDSEKVGVERSQAALITAPRPTFVVFDLEKKQSQDRELRKLITRAENFVQENMTESDLQTLYRNWGQTVEESVDGMVNFICDQVLADKTGKKAKEVLNFDKNLMSVKAILLEAKSKGLVHYTHIGSAWNLKVGDTEERLCSVKKNIPPEDAFVEWQQKFDDGNQVLTKLKTALTIVKV